MRNRKKGSSFSSLIVMVLVISAGLYVYFSSTFERNKPEVTMVTNGYWNLKTPLDIKISDDSGINSYRVILKSGQEVEVLNNEQLIVAQKSLELSVKPPKSALFFKDKVIEIIVEASDVSKWDFLNGNKTKQVFKLTIDKKRPRLSIVNNSYKINHGGSAVVIFSVDEENVEELYIQTDKKRFIAQPFYKDGYYISLLAWSVLESNFKANVVVKDKAGNMAKSYVPLYLKSKNYKISKIKISDKFLKGKIADLAEEFEETQGVEGSLEQFKIINEDVRAKNEKLIHELSSKVDDEKVSSFNMNKMYPLKNAAVVATFGDHRKYIYGRKYISESYHLGLDLASNAMATINPQNGGKVVFSDYNGLYGNMPMIHHGLGLYTLYGHCSTVKVNSGDDIIAKEVVANTGKSGYAMGDHLHFGVLVQGVEVRPQEWMDSQWIKLNVTDVIKDAKEIIDQI